jgi:cold shock CspA family protein
MNQHQQLIDKLNPQEDRQSGECVKWKNEADYGFIRSHSGERDLFCHIKWLLNGIPLTVGERVSFVCRTDPTGRPAAYEIRSEGNTDEQRNP